jgi:hypothetical protein
MLEAVKKYRKGNIGKNIYIDSNTLKVMSYYI